MNLTNDTKDNIYTNENEKQINKTLIKYYIY